MKTIIGKNQIIIERDTYARVGTVHCPGSLVPDFPCTLRDSIVCKYKRRFGILEGMMHICRIQLKYPRLHEALDEEEYKRLEKVYGLLSAIVDLKKADHEEVSGSHAR